MSTHVRPMLTDLGPGSANVGPASIELAPFRPDLGHFDEMLGKPGGPRTKTWPGIVRAQCQPNLCCCRPSLVRFRPTLAPLGAAERYSHWNADIATQRSRTLPSPKLRLCMAPGALRRSSSGSGSGGEAREVDARRLQHCGAADPHRRRRQGRHQYNEVVAESTHRGLPQ